MQITIYCIKVIIRNDTKHITVSKKVSIQDVSQVIQKISGVISYIK